VYRDYEQKCIAKGKTEFDEPMKNRLREYLKDKVAYNIRMSLNVTVRQLDDVWDEK